MVVTKSQEELTYGNCTPDRAHALAAPPIMTMVGWSARLAEKVARRTGREGKLGARIDRW